MELSLEGRTAHWIFPVSSYSTKFKLCMIFECVNKSQQIAFRKFDIQLMGTMDTFTDSATTFILGSCLAVYLREIFPHTHKKDNSLYIPIPVLSDSLNFIATATSERLSLSLCPSLSLSSPLSLFLSVSLSLSPSLSFFLSLLLSPSLSLSVSMSPSLPLSLFLSPSLFLSYVSLSLPSLSPSLVISLSLSLAVSLSLYVCLSLSLSLWERMTFAMIFETKERFDTGRKPFKSLWSRLDFLSRGFTMAAL